MLIHIFSSLCNGVESCHRSGIVHRDIKPSNIFLTDGGGLRLMDFSVAADRGATSMLEGYEDVRIGTLPYSAPEQILDPATATYETADIYSLGVVLYEMLTGHIPYYLHDGEDEEAYRLRVPFEAPVPPSAYRPELAPELEAVILKAMSRDPADRHQSVAELRDEVEAAFRASAAREAEPVAETPVLAPAKARRVLPWLALVPLPALLAWIFLAG
ncbi:MAG TPA: serine/threonine-protein kinase [Longimicrobiaceae bacterium]|jgi:serine/threonine-protein kinase|nr:serine/threonine-protein kinase [Longimicrobiaceae bacterium]